jgi:hypothetical protein
MRTADYDRIANVWANRTLSDYWIDDVLVGKALDAIRKYRCYNPSNRDLRRLERELKRIRWEAELDA